MDWYVSSARAELIFLMPFAGAALVVVTRVDKALFHFVTAEDRLLEWSQFGLYVAAALLGCVLAYRLRASDRLASLAYVAFAVGCSLVAGEEISWGQRIFHLQTPEALRHVNRQEELTVHNIRSVQSAANVALMLVGCYGAAASPLLHLRGRQLPTRAHLFVPPLFLTGCFFVLFLFKAGRFTVIPGGFTIVEYGEWPEFCLAFALAAFAFLGLRRVKIEEARR